jgi:murein DD-endopeptidase MepM/ murein hydrolase activator NlpD
MGFVWLALTKSIGCGSEALPETDVAPEPEPELDLAEFQWHWPLDGPVTSGFGWRDERHHDGVDIGARSGRAVEAAGPGTVVRAEWWYDYGRLVEIVHPDGRMTRYAHLDDIAVVDGEWVEARMVIGHVGMTGKVTGPHLHFELIEDGEPIDPIALSILFGPAAATVEAIAPPAPIEPPTMLGSILAAVHDVLGT